MCEPVPSLPSRSSPLPIFPSSLLLPLSPPPLLIPPHPSSYSLYSLSSPPHIFFISSFIFLFPPLTLLSSPLPPSFFLSPSFLPFAHLSSFPHRPSLPSLLDYITECVPYAIVPECYIDVQEGLWPLCHPHSMALSPCLGFSVRCFVSCSMFFFFK